VRYGFVFGKADIAVDAGQIGAGAAAGFKSRVEPQQSRR
jgi:hypothetical protein